MGIFTRMKDIVSANINAMLDKAEDPEKMIKLMIQEMEDTLVEIKAACAGSMAGRKRVLRDLDEASRRAEDWARKAKLALDKGREDLAREALVEKQRHQGEAERLEREANDFVDLVDRYQADIRQLEEKIESARKKHRLLVQRHIQAGQQKRARQEVRRASSEPAGARFDHYENKIERMESEANLVDYGRRPSLDEEFETFELDKKIEEELAALKEEIAKGGTKKKG